MNTPSPLRQANHHGCASLNHESNPAFGRILVAKPLHSQLKMKSLFLFFIFIVSLALPKASAQLYIDVYPSQDDANKTLWIFKGSSNAATNGWIRKEDNLVPPRNSITAHGDWRISGGNIYQANLPTNQFLEMRSLFSSANAMDIDWARGQTLSTASPTHRASPTRTANSFPICSWTAKTGEMLWGLALRGRR